MDVDRLHSSTRAAFHRTAARLHAEVYRRSRQGQPMSDVSAEVEQLICRVHSALEEWDGLSRSSPTLTKAADDCEAILAWLERLRSRYSA